MVETNPYEPPHAENTELPQKRYENPRDLWFGLGGITAGLLAMAFQVVLFITPGLISTWLVGGGVGLLAVGAMRLSAYLSDRRYSSRMAE